MVFIGLIKRGSQWFMIYSYWGKKNTNRIFTFKLNMTFLTLTFPAFKRKLTKDIVSFGLFVGTSLT